MQVRPGQMTSQAIRYIHHLHGSTSSGYSSELLAFVCTELQQGSKEKDLVPTQQRSINN